MSYPLISIYRKALKTFIWSAACAQWYQSQSSDMTTWIWINLQIYGSLAQLKKSKRFAVCSVIQIRWLCRWDFRKQALVWARRYRFMLKWSTKAQQTSDRPSSHWSKKNGTMKTGYLWKILLWKLLAELEGSKLNISTKHYRFPEICKLPATFANNSKLRIACISKRIFKRLPHLSELISRS